MRYWNTCPNIYCLYDMIQIIIFCMAYSFTLSSIYYQRQTNIQIQTTMQQVDTRSQSIPILKQSTIIDMVHQLQHATTQQQVATLEADIKLLFAYDKNLTGLTNVMVSKQLQNEYKIVFITFYSLLVQEYLSRFQHLNIDSKSKRARLDLDNLRKQIITLSNKIQKIIDCNEFPMHLKPDLIVLLFKLYSRRSQDWNSVKLPNKMEFYFRKGYVTLANAYFVNIIKYGSSARQKLFVYRKVMAYLPTCAANSLIKVMKGEGSPENEYKCGGYAEFRCALASVANMLQTVYLQFSKELVLNWCNLDVFVATAKTVIEELYNYEEKCMRVHPEEQIKQWHEVLLRILKKLSDYILTHSIVEDCSRFVKLLSDYAQYILRDKYFKLPIDQPDTYESRIGQYLPILANFARMQTSSLFILSSTGESVSSTEPVSYTLPMHQKLHFLKTSILPLYSCFVMRTTQFLAKECPAEEQTAYLETVDDFFRLGRADHESDNFMDKMVLFLRTNVEGLREIGYYVKNLIYTLLFSMQASSQNKGSVSYLESYFHNKDEDQIVRELPDQFYGNRMYKVEIGMLLCMQLYPYLSKDRLFIANCVGEFIAQVAAETGEHSIFHSSPQMLTMFVLMFKNYLCELPLSTKSNSMRLESFKYSGFVAGLSEFLCSRSAESNLLQVLIHFLLHYIKLTKEIIVHYKKSKLYTSYCDSLGFPELEGPLKEFHRYQNSVPIEYCCLLYVELVDYDIFRIEGETQEETIGRLNSVLRRMVQHNTVSNTKVNGDASGILGVMRNTHGILKVMQAVLACEQYTPIFQLVLQWLLGMEGDTRWLREYEEDIVDLCLVLLSRPTLLAGADVRTVSMFWQLVEIMLGLYSWSQQSIDEFHTNAFHSQQSSSQQSSQSTTQTATPSLMHKQLLMMYRASTFMVPASLVNRLYAVSMRALGQINTYMVQHRKKMKIFKVRPYQLCQIGHLLVLHQLIILRHGDLDKQSTGSLLELFWTNMQYRREYPTEFNYVHGKYSLIIVLLMKYKFEEFMCILGDKSPQIGHQILYQVYYEDHQYRVCYDAVVYVMHALDILEYIWNHKCQHRDLELTLKYAHFLVGGAALCLDRIYENYRYCKQEHMEISCLSAQLQNPTHCTNKWITDFVGYLTVNEPEVDEFQRFRQFYRKLIRHQALYKWFYDFMLLYFENQSYWVPYYEVFMIRKIKRSDGLYIYRVCRKYVRPN